MRRLVFYLSVALLAFGIGSFFVFKFYLKADTNKVSTTNYTNAVNKIIEYSESVNTGFDELINAKNGDFATVQGGIDIKFLCLDVTNSQQNVCTTVLIGSSSEKKSLLICLQVCNEQDKYNCIVWKPNNLCSDGVLCSDSMKIYDNNSNLIELVRYFEHNQNLVREYPNIQFKVTGKVSNTDGKYRLENPIERIEVVERQ
jgi:hypothetical protein